MPKSLTLEPIDNTVKGWEHARDQYNKSQTNTNDEVWRIEFFVKIESVGDTRDILNLRYFFPIGEDITRRGKEYKVNILFSTTQNETEKNWVIQDMERISTFLSQVDTDELHFDRENHIAWFMSYGYAELSKPKPVEPFPYEIVSDIVDIAKASCIVAQKDSGASNDQLLRSKELFDNISVQFESRGGSNMPSCILTIREAFSYKEYSDIENYVSKAIATYKPKPPVSFHFICQYAKRAFVSEIFPITRITNHASIGFRSTITAYRKYFSDPQRYLGTKKVNFSSVQKVRMRNQLTEKVDELTRFENDLVKAIFYFILRNHLDRKEIFTLDLYKKAILNNAVIDKAFADAKSYAEGIYQIIENSCLYSFGRCAYFGMRIHNADRNAPMSSFRNESRVRIRLSEKYSMCINNNVPNIFAGDQYSDYLELYVIDNASNQMGIIPNFNSKINIKNGKRIRQVKEIFEETEADYLERHSEPSEYYLTHYGLRWFKKIISKNQGYLIVVSPSGTQTSFYTGSDTIPESAKRYLPEHAYYTESSVLLPLSYEWQGENESRNISYKPLFGNTISTNDIKFREVNIDKEIIHVGESKEEKINLLYHYITRFSSPQLHFIVDDKMSPSDIEAFAKSVFKFIYLTHLENSARNLLMVIDFKSRRDLINEFVRIFSVFYDKVGKSRYMIGVQIALASERMASDEQTINEINFILGGSNYESAYATANIFLYYNSKSTAPFIPLLEYLTREAPANKAEKADNNTAVDIFPFDLYLKDTNDKSWFINKMDVLMNQDIRNVPYGCKISNTHISISSRIHLNTFFEAELLFHNIAIVYRFAYLIAQQIIKSIDRDNLKSSDNFLIVGYENYSSILIQQIAFWVKNTCNIKRNLKTAIIVTGENGLSEISYCDTKEFTGTINCYTVIPIGTTFSTIYRLHNDIRKLLAQNALFAFKDNFAVVSVCDELGEKKDLQSHPLVLKYWKKISPNQIILQPESSTYEDVSVHYLILTESKWYDNESCEICRTNLPLIQADKTSTLPAAIFELTNSNRRFLPPTENLELFEPQFNRNTGVTSAMVLYSHLYRGNNHYQFYFRFQEFVAKHFDKISKWAKGLKIDSDAYNIVISPLSVSNAQFLKIVLDNVFSSSLRLLHIDINNTYKEDIRAKFSYISSDYKAIKELNKNAQIHFYYIDDSIVTGQSINRGRMFLKMLLDESGLNIDSPIYFKKIILLINRSSYDTVNTFVEDAENDLYAFCNISIPSYNTNNNFCPGCAIAKKYELLKKRSASTLLREEFDRLSQKQEPRTPDEYERWLEKQIREKNSYFTMLRVYLYSLPDKAQAFDRSLRDTVTGYLYKYYQNHIRTQNTQTVLSAEHNLTGFLNSIRPSESYCNKVVGLVKFLIAQRAYTRLRTMNTAYERLQEIAKEQSPFDADDINLRIKDTIWELLEADDDNEAVISYIKVISREHLSTYYHIRRAIMEVMSDLLKAFIGEPLSDDSPAHRIAARFESAQSDFNPQKYQAVIIITHRLAMLQSSILLDHETVEKTIRFFENERKQFDALMNKDISINRKLLLLRFPSQEQLVKQYVKSLKITTMLDKDDNMCNRLLTLYEELTR